MAHRGRPCSICVSPARRAVVDAALSTGVTVARVIEDYAEAFGFSPAAAYRHARHRHRVGHPLTVDLPEGEAPADLQRHLVRALEALDAQLARAEAVQDERLITASADKIRANVSELRTIGGNDYAATLQELEGMRTLVGTLRDVALEDPSAIDTLADIASRVQRLEPSDQLRSLASYARDRRNPTPA